MFHLIFSHVFKSGTFIVVMGQLLSNILKISPVSQKKLPSKVTVDSFVQPKKTYGPICVTLWGIVIDVRFVQPQKEPPSIEVTLLGIETEVISQSQKAPLIKVTL